VHAWFTRKPKAAKRRPLKILGPKLTFRLLVFLYPLPASLKFDNAAQIEIN